MSLKSYYSERKYIIVYKHFKLFMCKSSLNHNIYKMRNRLNSLKISLERQIAFEIEIFHCLSDYKAKVIFRKSVLP